MGGPLLLSDNLTYGATASLRLLMGLTGFMIHDVNLGTLVLQARVADPNKSLLGTFCLPLSGIAGLRMYGFPTPMVLEEDVLELGLSSGRNGRGGHGMKRRTSGMLAFKSYLRTTTPMLHPA